MTDLPNLNQHPDRVGMGTTKRRHIRSNARDRVLQASESTVVGVDCTAGGTIVLNIDQQQENGLIKLTGSPAGAFNVEVFDGDRRLEFLNVTGEDATVDTATGATSPEVIPDTRTRILNIDGIDITVSGSIAIQDGALLQSGVVSPTAGINFADFELKKAFFKDFAFKVTSPTISSNVLVLDVENSNYFDVTLDDDVTTLTLSNPLDNPDNILLEDGSGIILLESGDDLLLEEANALVSIYFIARQDSGGGNEITWPDNVQWEQNTGDSPNQTITGNAIDIYWLFSVNGGTTWFGIVLGLDMK